MKVSVITICYNAVNFIEKTIQSVLNQNYDNLEYIIIDGGSNDGTTDIIKKYKQRLAYFSSEKDNGIYDAMNKGVRSATGEWVNFMNAGDVFFDGNVLKNIFERISIADAIKVIGGNVRNVYSDHTEIVKAFPASKIPYWMPFCHQSMFVRRSLCHFNLKYKLAADYNLLYDIYHKYGDDSIMVVDIVIAVFMMEGSTSYTHLLKTKYESLKIQFPRITLFWIKEFVKFMLHKLYVIF